MNHRFTLLCGFLLLSVLPSSTPAADSVQATIEKETAWTGEAVPLFVTLYSPGPFSGTASFELPEFARTAIIKIGNPVVGSQEVDDESYLTQRHEFRIYTQQTGEIVLPPFRVRFAGKRTFTSEPEPMEGMTPKLRFRSNRPPGTEGLGVVIATTQIEVSQSWLPQNQSSFQAGDVIQRTVTRQAGGTTAMMLPPLSLNAPSGIRIYETRAIVEDKTQRGQFDAIRVDTIKYQFEYAGTFDLPAIEFVHWDPDAAELELDTLPGITVSVTPAPGDTAPGDTAPGDTESETTPSTTNRPIWKTLGSVFTLMIFGWLFRKPAARTLADWRAKRNSSGNLAARRVEAACRTNDPSAAYSALLDWQRTLIISGADIAASETIDLQRECAVLSTILFGANASETRWSGQRLLAAFKDMRREVSRSQNRKSTHAVLPKLNPT